MLRVCCTLSLIIAFAWRKYEKKKRIFIIRNEKNWIEITLEIIYPSPSSKQMTTLISSKYYDFLNKSAHLVRVYMCNTNSYELFVYFIVFFQIRVEVYLNELQQWCINTNTIEYTILLFVFYLASWIDGDGLLL